MSCTERQPESAFRLPEYYPFVCIVAELKKHYGVANALMYYSYTAGVVALYCIFISTTIIEKKS
ncbi:hypothetical protein [Alysiella crassa]|uniref:hypothetical protein n=1 Tax=Alysiella crassa TaxID=153491 RepID=UPI000E209B14|nr:hypothetical protein [Alysiella crassa]UOP06483.1 hypothetical protein LVJ80_12075 [Alysiella crassa]